MHDKKKRVLQSLNRESRFNLPLITGLTSEQTISRSISIFFYVPFGLITIAEYVKINVNEVKRYAHDMDK